MAQRPLGIIAADQKWFSEGEALMGTRAWVGANDLGRMAAACYAFYVSYIKAVRIASTASVGFLTRISAESYFFMHENSMKVSAYHDTAG